MPIELQELPPAPVGFVRSGSILRDGAGCRRSLRPMPPAVSPESQEVVALPEPTPPPAPPVSPAAASLPAPPISAAPVLPRAAVDAAGPADAAPQSKPPLQAVPKAASRVSRRGSTFANASYEISMDSPPGKARAMVLRRSARHSTAWRQPCGKPTFFPTSMRWWSTTRPLAARAQPTGRLLLFRKPGEIAARPGRRSGTRFRGRRFLEPHRRRGRAAADEHWADRACRRGGSRLFASAHRIARSHRIAGRH